MSLTIRVERLQHGQPGPYRPHIYEARLTTEWERERDRLDASQIKDLAKVVVHWFTEEPETDLASHFEPRLHSLEQTAAESYVNGEWRAVEADERTRAPRRETWLVHIEEPFTES